MQSMLAVHFKQPSKWPTNFWLPKLSGQSKTFSYLQQRLPVSEVEVVKCVSVKSDMLGNVFSPFPRSCSLISFQLLLMFWDNDTLQWWMFLFNAGLLQRPDKHENEDKDWKFYSGTLIFKCNFKIFCCSTFVMKDMFGNSKEDVWWDSHFPSLGLGFQKINKAAFRVLCILSSSSRLLADHDKPNCQSWKSHIWLLFSSENGNSPNMQNNTLTSASLALRLFPVTFQINDKAFSHVAEPESGNALQFVLCKWCCFIP